MRTRVKIGSTPALGQQKTHGRLTSRWLAVLLPALLLVAGCGGLGSDSTSESASTSTPTTGETGTASGQAAAESETAAEGSGEATTVRYTQAGTSLSFANLLYAQSEGLFEAEGLNMEYQPFPPSSGDMITIMLAGDADVGFGAPSAMYSAVTQGRDLKNYASTQIGPVQGITISNDLADELEAEGITADSPLEERIAALEGRSLAGVGAGSSSEALVGMILEIGGLQAGSDVTLLPVPDHAEAANATREGQSDGYYAAAPAVLAGELDGWGTTWISFLDVPDIGTMPWIEFTSSEAFAEENPEVIEGMLRAIKTANEAFESDPDSVQAVLKEEWFAETDPELFEASFELALPTFTQGIQPTEQGLETQLTVSNIGAEVPVDLAFEEVYDTSFLDELDTDG